MTKVFNIDIQQVFNRVAAHLLTQNVVSGHNPGDCLYRYNGLKCAIGCLISDEFYDARFEGGTVTPDEDIHDGLDLSKAVSNAVKASLGIDKLNSRDSRFLHDLRFIHDMHSPVHWRERLNELAARYELRGIA